MTKEEYEDLLLRLDVQRQMALNNEDPLLHAEIMEKMINLSEKYYEEASRGRKPVQRILRR
jgi:hypothetical protein